MRSSTSSTSCRPRRSPRCSSRPAPTAEQASRCLALAEIRTTDTSFVERVRALGVEHDAARRGPGRAGRGRRGLRLAGRDHRRRRVADLRSPAASTTTPAPSSRPACAATRPRLDLLRRPLRRAGQRRPHDVPRRRHLLRRLPRPGPAARRRRPGGRPQGAERRAGRGHRRGVARGAARPWPPRCAPAASPCEVAATRRSSASRSGTPSAAASRSSGSRDDADGTSPATRSRTSGRGEQDDADPDTWTPPAADLRPQVLIKENHSDPHPRRRHPARRARRPDRHPRRLGRAPPRPRRRRLHRPARGQRRRPGRDPRRGGRAPAARRVLPQGHRRGRSRARRATRTPTCPPASIEVIATDVEVLSASAPLPFPIDDHVDVGEEVRLKYRYLDLRRSGPNARDPAAQQGQQGRARRAGPARASSRSRPRR